MLNSQYLRRMKNQIKSEMSLSDHNEIETNVFYCVENINSNLSLVENSFSDLKGKEDVVLHRMAILRIVDDILENISERIEDKREGELNGG
tara:strand:+ start:26 stop:298 length:273 start_codon:yes stop_codon:yes gene_type:complete